MNDNSISFNSVAFHSIPFCSIPFDSNPVLFFFLFFLLKPITLETIRTYVSVFILLSFILFYRTILFTFLFFWYDVFLTTCPILISMRAIIFHFCFVWTTVVGENKFPRAYKNDQVLKAQTSKSNKLNVYELNPLLLAIIITPLFDTVILFLLDLFSDMMCLRRY